MKNIIRCLGLVVLLFIAQPFSVYAEDINFYYEVVPTNIREAFVEDGWVIKAEPIDLGEKYFEGELEVLAATAFAEQTIYIDTSRDSDSSIIHEMGHFLDYKLGFISSTKEFKFIYELELDKFRELSKTHKHNTGTVLEYYAEAFQEILLEPERMLSDCPYTYGFISACMQML